MCGHIAEIAQAPYKPSYTKRSLLELSFFFSFFFFLTLMDMSVENEGILLEMHNSQK